MTLPLPDMLLHAFVSPEAAAAVGYVAVYAVASAVGLVLLVLLANVLLAPAGRLVYGIRPWVLLLPCPLVASLVRVHARMCITLPDGARSTGWGEPVGSRHCSMSAARTRPVWWTWPLPAFVPVLLVWLLRRPMPVWSVTVYPLQPKRFL